MNDDEPEPVGNLPPAPAYLSPRAKTAWEQFGEELSACGVCTSLDATALELLVTSYAQYLDAAENVAKYGAVWIEAGTSKIPKFQYSPYWAVMNRAWKQVQAMLAEFGMTPSSRSRVVAVKSEAEREIEAFIAGKF